MVCQWPSNPDTFQSQLFILYCGLQDGFNKYNKPDLKFLQCFKLYHILFACILSQFYWWSLTLHLTYLYIFKNIYLKKKSYFAPCYRHCRLFIQYLSIPFPSLLTPILFRITIGSIKGSIQFPWSHKDKGGHMTKFCPIRNECMSNGGGVGNLLLFPASDVNVAWSCRNHLPELTSLRTKANILGRVKQKGRKSLVFS